MLWDTLAYELLYPAYASAHYAWAGHAGMAWHGSGSGWATWAGLGGLGWAGLGGLGGHGMAWQALRPTFGADERFGASIAFEV